MDARDYSSGEDMVAPHRLQGEMFRPSRLDEIFTKMRCIQYWTTPNAAHRGRFALPS